MSHRESAIKLFFNVSNMMSRSNNLLLDDVKLDVLIVIQAVYCASHK